MGSTGARNITHLSFVKSKGCEGKIALWETYPHCCRKGLPRPSQTGRSLPWQHYHLCSGSLTQKSESSAQELEVCLVTEMVRFWPFLLGSLIIIISPKKPLWDPEAHKNVHSWCHLNILLWELPRSLSRRVCVLISCRSALNSELLRKL